MANKLKATGLTRALKMLPTLFLPLTIKYNVDQAKLKPAPLTASPSYIIQPPNKWANPNVKQEVLVGLDTASLWLNLKEEPEPAGAGKG